MMKRRLLGIVLLMCIGVAGCAPLARIAPTATATQGKPCPFANALPDPAATPTMLQTVRPYNLVLNLPEFSHCTTDVTLVHRLYAAALALPLKAPGGYACPKSWGITYELTFLAGGVVVRMMTQEADGCGFLHLSETDIRATNEAFRQQVASTIGLPSLLPFSSHASSGTT